MLYKANLYDTVYIYDDSTKMQVEHEIRAMALKTGHGITWSDGTKEHYEWVEVYDSTKEAGEAYTWDKDGKKCLHELVKVVTIPGKDPVKSVLRKALKTPDWG